MIRTRARTKWQKLNAQTFLTKLLENFPIYSMLVHVTFHNCKQEIKYVGSNCLLAFHEPLKSFQNQVIVFLALLSARGLGMKLLFLFGLSCFQSVKNDTNDTFDAQSWSETLCIKEESVNCQIIASHHGALYLKPKHGQYLTNQT